MMHSADWTVWHISRSLSSPHFILNTRSSSQRHKLERNRNGSYCSHLHSTRVTGFWSRHRRSFIGLCLCIVD
ncbi:hypothetical protein AHF37_11086 [Paragonimus kellicotti]|nr:hypothetical protein AHF37_11086 [Paragonimus kellicotti]